jgi:multidrug efflux system outer membrane protein
MVLALGAAGCTLGPDYQRPMVPAPPNWREIPVAEAESLANTAWWELFDDPQLQELIRIALAENKDLKIAIERIEEARARYGIAKADLWPYLSQGAAGGRLRFADGSLSHTPSGDDSVSVDNETSIYAVSADVSWELDFFGRIRRTGESQLALLLGTEEARRSTVLALVADVARAYFELSDFDRRLAIARRTIESRRDYVVLARDRFEGGVTPEIDFRQAEAELKRVETVVFELERLIAAKENELSVLLGRSPSGIMRGRTVEEQKLPEAVPAGLPSELLDRRPDIREAEQLLASGTANIGAAKALLFPRFALTGSFGWASTEFDDLFESSSKSWNIIGNQLQPIFDAGKNRRRIEVTESQQRQTLYNYERTILQAFRETEDALVAYRKTGEQRQAQAKRVGAERKVLELAELRYLGGVADYLEVLDAQRSLFGAELDEAETIGGHLVALVRLYKALGGGWPGEPMAIPASAGQAATDAPPAP